jgi:hypothetical protein
MSFHDSYQPSPCRVSGFKLTLQTDYHHDDSRELKLMIFQYQRDIDALKAQLHQQSEMSQL